MSKVRIIMRDMIGMMLLGKSPDVDAYTALATMPEVIDPSTYSGCYFERDRHGEKAVALSAEIRNIAKSALVMKAKTRRLAEEGAAAGGLSKNGQAKKVSLSVGAMDGATDEPDEEDEDEDAEGEIEGDDLNASDAEGGADGDED